MSCFPKLRAYPDSTNTFYSSWSNGSSGASFLCLLSIPQTPPPLRVRKVGSLSFIHHQLLQGSRVKNRRGTALTCKMQRTCQSAGFRQKGALAVGPCHFGQSADFGCCATVQPLLIKAFPRGGPNAGREG